MANNLALIFSAAIWLLIYASDKDAVARAFGSPVGLAMMTLAMLFVISFFVHLGSYDDPIIALRNIEKRTPFLAFPLIASSVGVLNKDRIRNLFDGFVISVFVAGLICLLFGVIKTLQSGTMFFINPRDFVQENNFTYHRLSSFIGIHAVYLSAYALFALLIVIESAYENRIPKKKAVPLIVFFIALILLLKSIAILAAMAICLLFYLIRFVQNKKVSRRGRYAMVIGSIVVGASVVAVSYNKLYLKQELISYDLLEMPGEQNNWNSLNFRLAKWRMAREALRENWILGVGPGNLKYELLRTYDKFNFRFGVYMESNPHNQFLHTFLVLGITGFIALVALFAFAFRESFLRRDLLMFCFVVLLFLFSGSESVFALNKGIVFGSFFLSLLSYLPKPASSYLWSS